MNYIIKCMNNDILKEIISWKYEGQYEVYNMDSYDKLKQRGASILDVNKKDNYVCFFCDDELVGYTNISKKNDKEIFLGIGLSPKYCGKGFGKDILNKSIEEIKRRYKNVKISLKVRSWNKRAISCYMKAGFNIINTVIENDHNNIKTEFIIMEYNV